MLGTNGGGFYGMNSAHPYENPTASANFLNTLSMMIGPYALVLMYGRMLGRLRHSLVIFSVMWAMMAGTIMWSVYFDTLNPNPGLTGHPMARSYEIPSATAPGGKQVLTLPPVAGLPVDQRLGNLEGKELRFGISAGATYAAVTTDVTCGAVNAEADSLNPIAALSPMVGMWLNSLFGGKGVGMVNMLLYVMIGIFVAGMMVGRTPEYLGKKIEAREIKLAMIALLIHPLLILGPSGLFAATNWGQKAVSNPGPHGLSQIVYQFSSSSANNGSAFNGLGVTYGFNDNPKPAPTAIQWDIAGGIVMLLARYLPIIAPIAMAASLGAKKASPFGLGTLRDDGATFGVLLLGTVLIIGALLFLPVAALGPVAEHLGPIPFGG
jgi:K+-transporting ATPase ATPase A chain